MSKARELAQKPNQPTGRKNLIINGAMVIDQRNGGSAVTGSAAVGKFAADRYSLYANTTATITAQQVSDAPDDFEKSNKFTCTNAASSDTSGSRVQLYQAIEGYNTAHLQFGSSNAKTITLSFWVKASNTGTYGGAFTNGVINRAYPYQYTISSANTWEYKTVTITGDTSGTWATDNAGGLYLFWSLGVGSNYEGTANQWNGAFDIAPPSSFSLKDNLNATWQITGVQLEVGSVATEFEHRSYGEELALCQRYYNAAQYSGTTVTYNTIVSPPAIYHPVQMRSSPQLTFGGVASSSSDPISGLSSTVEGTHYNENYGFAVYVISTSTGYGWINYSWQADAEL
jgi:hypothetical protein